MWVYFGWSIIFNLIINIALTELLVVPCADTEINDNQNEVLATKPINKCFEFFDTGNRQLKLGKFSIITSALLSNDVI